MKSLEELEVIAKETHEKNKEIRRKRYALAKELGLPAKLAQHAANLTDENIRQVAKEYQEKHHVISH